MESEIPQLENLVTANYDAIANFSLIFHNSEFLMKIEFPNITQKFYFYLVCTKIPELQNSQI